MSVLDAECARRNAVSVIHVVPFTEPLQALPGVKAALRGGTADIADLQARLDCAANNLVVLLGRHGGRRKPRTLLQEHDLRELIALWSEVKAALEARRLSPFYGAVRRAISSRINPPAQSDPLPLRVSKPPFAAVPHSRIRVLPDGLAVPEA